MTPPELTLQHPDSLSSIFPFRPDPNQSLKKIFIFLMLFDTFLNLALAAIPKWG
jgi:hypothetical protein